MKTKEKLQKLKETNIDEFKPNYCFKKSESLCEKEKICFHILNNQENKENQFKNKTNILIYGPNGSGKTVLSQQLYKESKNDKKNKIFIFDSDYINKTVYYTNEKGERKTKKTHKNEIIKKFKIENQIIRKNNEKNQRIKEIEENYFSNKLDYLTSNKEFSDLISKIKTFDKKNIFETQIKNKIKNNNKKKFNSEKDINDLSLLLKKYIDEKNDRFKISFLKDVKPELNNEAEKINLKLKELFCSDLNLKNISNEIDNFKNELIDIKKNHNINKKFKKIKEAWFEIKNLNKVINENEFEEKWNIINKFLKWKKIGASFYDKENKNFLPFEKNFCIFCFEKTFQKNEKVDELLNEKNLQITEKEKEKFKRKIFHLANYLEKNLLNYFDKREDLKKDLKKDLDDIRAIYDEINEDWEDWLINENINIKTKINNNHFIKGIENKMKTFWEKENYINVFYEFFEETMFFKNILFQTRRRKYFENKLKNNNKEINEETNKETNQLILKINDELCKINNEIWKIKFNIKLTNICKGGKPNIVFETDFGKNNEVFQFASTGERKVLALILFFIQIKKVISQDQDSKFILIFDDISDELDFSANFKIDKLLKYFLEVKEKNFKNKIKYKIFLTHRIDFVFTFYMQHLGYEKYILFFRLFNNVKYKFLLNLNFEKLMIPDLILFKKYLIKFLNSKNGNEKKFEKLILWAISKRSIEVILAQKYHLIFREKINYSEDKNYINDCYEKCIEYLFKINEKTDKKEDRYKHKENIKDFLQKWKDKKTFLSFDKNSKWKIENFNFSKAVDSIVYLLKKIKIINAEENLSENENLCKNKEENKIFLDSFTFEQIEKKIEENIKILKDGNYEDKEDKYIYYILLNYTYFFMKKIENKKEANKMLEDEIYKFLRHANNNFFPNLLIYDKEFFDALNYEIKEEIETEENKELLLEVEKNN